MTALQLFEKLKAGDKAALAKAITLAESRNPKHRADAAILVSEAMRLQTDTVRVGITGVPGVGKSTFIDTFGSWLVQEKGKKVCVLAIDPSSSRSHGSILADKTRMEQLSALPDVFIRPTAAGSVLGGIGGNTLETVLLCEAAGYNYILVETVGVGQNEYLADNVVDCLMLLVLANAGDEIQGIKRGIMELADIVVLNKADISDSKQYAGAMGDLMNAVKLLPKRYPGWTPEVLKNGLNDHSNALKIFDCIASFISFQKQNQNFDSKRSTQLNQWFEGFLRQKLETAFFNNPAVIDALSQVDNIKFQNPDALADKLIEDWRKQG